MENSLEFMMEIKFFNLFGVATTLSTGPDQSITGVAIVMQTICIINTFIIYFHDLKFFFVSFKVESLSAFWFPVCYSRTHTHTFLNKEMLNEVK